MSRSSFSEEPRYRGLRSARELQHLEKAFQAQRRSYRRLGFSTEIVDQDLAMIRLARVERHTAAPAPFLGRFLLLGRSLLLGGTRRKTA